MASVPAILKSIRQRLREAVSREEKWYIPHNSKTDLPLSLLTYLLMERRLGAFENLSIPNKSKTKSRPILIFLPNSVFVRSRVNEILYVATK